MKQLISLLLSLSLCAAMLSGCGQKQSNESGTEPKGPEGISIELSDGGVKVDGETAPTDSTAAVYTANDIIYYEAGHDFTYGEGSESDAHSAEEAAAHTVVHITQPGSYVLSGTLSAGQVAVDLGKEAEDDPNAVVTLVLNGVDITCTVAPAVIFYNVYECGSDDEETATKDVDTSAAGANVIIADGTTNTVNGAYVARIYKPESVVLSEDGTKVVEEKKLHKYDAAFYSKMSMNVDGETTGASNMNAGVLYINAENEGLDSELHLTINGGIIDIRSGNDGINTNEDNVSVTTVNGGYLNIAVTGETGEGDGIDSNGWLVINGGTVIAAACGSSMDSGIDSDKGIHINGGTVIASGNMLDRIEAGGQNYAVFQFAGTQPGGTSYTLKPEDGHMLATYSPVNDHSNLLVSDAGLTAGDYTLWQGESAVDGVQMSHSGSSNGMGGMGGFRPGGFGGMPEGFDPGQFGDRMPENFDPSQFGGQMPGNVDPSQFGGQMPESFDPNSFGGKPGGQMPGNLDPSQFDGQMPGGSGKFDGQIPEGFDPNGFGGNRMPPEGGERPEGFAPGGFGGMGSQGGESSVTFTLVDGGVTFSGVMAVSGTPVIIGGEQTA